LYGIGVKDKPPSGSRLARHRPKKAEYGSILKEVIKMAYVRKTIDRWDIMSNYGYGWECECSEYTRKEAEQRLKEYRENGNGCYRLEKHREKKEVI
jgi:predicted SprT family Zn-dependent metalloprotease